MNTQRHDWHTKPVSAVRAHFRVHEDSGLLEEVCRSLREIHGRNELAKQVGRSPLVIFFGQLTDSVVAILVFAAIVSGLVGELADTVVILLIVAIDSVIGGYQELRASRAMEALSVLSAPRARVMREGRVVDLESTEIVPGDVVLLVAGDIVPADVRLVSAHRLAIAESALTGESVPVHKQVEDIPELALTLGDRTNLAFAGTEVTSGSGVGITIATGRDTELGQIASLLRNEEIRTPLQVRLSDLARRLTVVTFLVCVVVFVWGIIKEQSLISLSLTVLSLAVAVIPESLPTVVTIALARGARKMAASHALARRLAVVEALGSVSYICTDKTGTLTQNEMEVASLRVGGELRPYERGAERGNDDPPFKRLVEGIGLNYVTAAAPVGVRSMEVVDPMERALVGVIEREGFSRKELEERYPRIDELPFDAERRMMTTVHRDNDSLRVITKGAPEVVLPRCRGWEMASERWSRVVEEMAGSGMRVIAYGFRDSSGAGRLDSDSVSEIEMNLELAGLVGLIDPPRREARDALVTCQRAGIRVMMITGDHPSTARAIGAMVGIKSEDTGMITGSELTRLTDGELDERIDTIQIAARISPDQKLRLVESLRRRGEFVAMTGDGVNDAPALQAATVGVAMGKGGTDVAREASDVILLDDNFATIVAAIREGRVIYDAIRKFVRFVLASNVAELLLVCAAPIIGLPLPLLPIHLLWINVITDGFPGLALTLEPEEGDTMMRPPRPPEESIFAQGLGVDTVIAGCLLAGAALLTAHLAYGAGEPAWRSMVFTELTLSQLLYVLSARIDRGAVGARGLLRSFQGNSALMATVFLSILLQIAILFIPPIAHLLQLHPLSATAVSWCIGMAAVPVVLVEGVKRVSNYSPLRL